jgi:hypothetical protein
MGIFETGFANDVIISSAVADVAIRKETTRAVKIYYSRGWDNIH